MSLTVTKTLAQLVPLPLQFYQSFLEKRKKKVKKIINVSCQGNTMKESMYV